MQPIERVHGKLVVFGEGQLLSNQTAACCPVQTEDGMLVFLHILVKGHKSKVTSINYMPTWDRHPDYTVLPIGEALRRHQESAQVLRDSYDRTVSVVGRIRHVVEPIPARLPRHGGNADRPGRRLDAAPSDVRLMCVLPAASATGAT